MAWVRHEAQGTNVAMRLTDQEICHGEPWLALDAMRGISRSSLLKPRKVSPIRTAIMTASARTYCCTGSDGWPVITGL